MRALLIADESFAWRERLLLSRLEVGLADIGVAVTRAEPERENRKRSQSAGLTSTSIAYRRVGIINSPRAQAQAMIDQLIRIKPSIDDTPIDVVHAFGETCWPLAVEAAQRLDAFCAMELWSRHSVDLIPRIERRCQRAGTPLLWLAPDEPIRAAAQAQHARSPCRVTAWGVHTPDTKREWDPNNEIRSIAVLSSGGEPQSINMALEGVARIVRKAPSTLVFLDAKAMANHDKVWRHAESQGLLEHLSVIPDMEARRELVLRCDLLLLPEARGEHRTLTLDAMASGMVVVAKRDPLVAYLDQPGPAVLVESDGAGAWEDAIGRVVEDAATAQSAIDTARGFVMTERRASDHAQALYDSITWMTGRDSIQIEDIRPPKRAPGS